MRSATAEAGNRVEHFLAAMRDVSTKCARGEIPYTRLRGAIYDALRPRDEQLNLSIPSGINPQQQKVMR